MGLEHVKLHNVHGVDDVAKLLNWIADDVTRPIAVDTETTGFYPDHGDYVRLGQLGDLDHGWAFDWNRWSGLFDAVMKTHTGPVIMHNAPFDYAFTRKGGVQLDRSRIRDTRVMSHILEPHMSTALKNQTKRHVDPLAGALQHNLDTAMSTSGWTWGTIPVDFPMYWQYGTLDTVLTAHLYDKLYPRVTTEAPRAFDVENSVQWVYEAASRYGAHVDVKYAQLYYDKFIAYCAQVDDWCRSEYNVKPGSNAAIVQVLSDAGIEFSKATKSGAVSLDGEVLEGIDHPLAQAVLRRRRLQKLASTYLLFYLTKCDSNDLVHPSINSLGARTGRSSMDHPNLQNLPRSSENNPAATVVRNCISARDGHTMLFCDFDQIEMRGLAIMSGDPGLVAAFASPEDFFVTLARSVYQDDAITKKDERRRVTKNVGYAKIYGAGVAKMALTAGVPLAQARYANDGFDSLYPGVREFQDLVYREAMQRRSNEGVAYTTCPLTGRRHVADPGKEYALVNYKIQGWAATLLKTKALELDAAGLGPYIVAPVHDELILDVPNDLVRDAVHTLQAIMNDDKQFPVPITSSVSYGQRWGEKKEWTN